MMKIGRNAPCPCGSGKKYKRCHGDPLRQRAFTTHVAPAQMQEIIREINAKEKRRIDAQGYGRPIISTNFKGRKFVAVGSTIHFSEKWVYFSDFLMDFIKKKIGNVWGSAEIKKPFEERHPLMQWYHLFCEFQSRLQKDKNGHMKADMDGLATCYLGLAYNLYLLEHNAELQDRYIKRIKDPRLFQGAYYELIVASCMIRAGFELKLEDETDRTQKHCEFSAVSKHTGKKYWVEAKMRSVSGILGKTNADGQPPTSRPTSRLSTHLKLALAKPATDDRIIFIDVNAEPMTPDNFASDPPTAPKWMDAAERQLGDREKNLKEGERAYVYVTNFCFHNALTETFRGQAVLTFGLGMDDYGKPRAYSLPDAWRVKQKHIDMFALEEALKGYPQIPNRFEDDLPPVAEGDRERIKIGKTYNFEDSGIIGKVTTACVSEEEKRIYVAVSDQDGKSHLLSEEISDNELEVYRANRDTYFSVILPATKKANTPYEFFEFMMDSYKDTCKEKLLEWMMNSPDIDDLKKMEQKDLALTYCERITIYAMQRRPEASR